VKQAVVFDLDGTLLDTLEDLAGAVNRVLASHAFPAHPLDAYRYFVGDGARTLFERVLPEHHRSEPMIETCLEEFREDYGRNWNIRTAPYPDIERLLEALTARGTRLSVLSNKPHETTLACVRGILPRWEFDVVLGQRPGVPKKPDPAGALELASRMGLPPEAFLYLGDTGTDMLTASAAGMLAVGALWGFRTAEELTAHGARHLVASPMEVLGLLESD
jgi:phosphoglycolate phosphatase